ncbi:hemerythrin domain-containing protein [Hoeflea sp.]|uniref:hemerythrin domain-containing protein n=1 Tax=Hoeflea sp. TaxID=1940281 RepID=UPI003BAE38E3
MDITQLILDDHAEQRRLFAALEEIDPSDVEALSAVWGRLKALLDSHAEAEERYFYPELLKLGKGAADADSADDETEDAIDDHNDIRDTGEEVEKHRVGSKDWFAAVAECNVANSHHLGEEERQGLADFRRHASFELRHELAVRFLAFQCAHLTGVRVVDKDPEKYLEDPEQEIGKASE